MKIKTLSFLKNSNTRSGKHQRLRSKKTVKKVRMRKLHINTPRQHASHKIKHENNSRSDKIS